MVDAPQAEHKPIAIEVVYAREEEQILIPLEVPDGTTLEEAVKFSGLAERFTELSRMDLKLGVFGELGKPGQIVKPGDRVEIYRPLLHDPKDSRRQRAQGKPAH